LPTIAGFIPPSAPSNSPFSRAGTLNLSSDLTRSSTSASLSIAEPRRARTTRRRRDRMRACGPAAARRECRKAP